MRTWAAVRAKAVAAREVGGCAKAGVRCLDWRVLPI